MNLNKIFSEIDESCYIFNRNKFLSNCNSFYSAFSKRYSKVNIAYSYKTNYLPSICKIIDSKGYFSEVVSEMELKLAYKLGVDPKNVIYNGPTKSKKSLIEALDLGTVVHVDNFEEFLFISNHVKNNINKNYKIGIRLNFSINHKENSRFGIDVNSNEINEIIKLLAVTANLKVVGLHCHFPFRDLNSFTYRIEGLINFYKKNYFKEVEYLDIGGGFSSEMSKDLKSQFNYDVPNFDDYAITICTPLNDFFKDYKNKPMLILEPGSALVANVLTFAAKVISIKKVGKKSIVHVDGSKYNFNANSKRHINLPHLVYNLNKLSKNKKEVCDVAGFTCIETDYLLKNVSINVNIGDFVIIENVGSYSFVMKPPFILPNYPIIEFNKKLKVLKEKEVFSNIFETFNFKI